VAGRDDDFDTWTPDGTQPLGVDSDAAWTSPAEQPAANEPSAAANPPTVPPPPNRPTVERTPTPDAPAVERSVAPPPDARPARRSVAPPSDARPARRSVVPPSDAPAARRSVPPSGEKAERRLRRSDAFHTIRVFLFLVCVLGGVIWYGVRHVPRAGHQSVAPVPSRICSPPTYHLSTSAAPALAIPAAASGQTQTSERRHLAFARPPGWQAESSEDALDGYEDRCGSPQIVLSGVAKFGTGYCVAQPTAFRAIAGVRGASGKHDLAAVAGQVATVWATWSYAGKGDEQPQVVVGSARPFVAGGLHGSLVRATARGTVPLECGSVQGVVYAIAIDSAAGADVFVISADQGDAADPSESSLLAIAASLHRVP
jgi:hypothetical protein